MKKIFTILFIIFLIFGLGGLLGLYISTHNVGVLEPKGWIADQERHLIYLSSLLMLIIVIPVLILTFVFAWKYREGNKTAKYNPDWEHHYVAEMCWWGLPFVIIAILSVITWKTSHELNPFKPIVNDKKAVKIQAVALNWKWLFIYPKEGIATINLVRFPEKTPIHFEITADAPMNSFWIPQLGGQIYAMSSMRSKLSLIAKEQGNYDGRSSNMSGKGFAGMVFKAQSVSDEQFDEWIDSVRDCGKRLTMESYEDLVKPSEYDPVSYYVLSDGDLFERIMMKYMMQQERKD